MSNLKKRRLPAEWEPQDAVMMTFPHHQSDWAPVLHKVLPCFIEIAAAISRFQPVIILCSDPKITAKLKKKGTPERIYMLDIDSNDTWARDHAAITVFEGKKPVTLDFVFNGWGLKFPAFKDNLITAAMAELGVFKGKTQQAGMVLEGGGIESDGQGTLLTTAFCLESPNRNPHLSRKKTEKKLRELLGAKCVHWLQNGFLAGDDTDSHIDTLARFCDASTIAYVQCLDEADEHFEALRLMEEELKKMRAPGKKKYRLVPLPLPDACYDGDGQRLPATYANFLIINGAVLVPVYGVPQDQAALSILGQVFADREVIGIDCSTLIWQHGSLHCVTMQFPKGSIQFKNLQSLR